MACRRIGAKPLSKPMLTYCQLDPKEHISMKFNLKFKYFHSRKCVWTCRLQNGSHFVQGSTIFTFPSTLHVSSILMSSWIFSEMDWYDTQKFNFLGPGRYWLNLSKFNFKPHLIVWTILEKALWCECNRTYLIRNQQWFSYGSVPDDTKPSPRLMMQHGATRP